MAECKEVESIGGGCGFMYGEAKVSELSCTGAFGRVAVIMHGMPIGGERGKES